MVSSGLTAVVSTIVTCRRRFMIAQVLQSVGAVTLAVIVLSALFEGGPPRAMRQWHEVTDGLRLFGLLIALGIVGEVISRGVKRAYQRVFRKRLEAREAERQRRQTEYDWALYDFSHSAGGRGWAPRPTSERPASVPPPPERPA